MSNLCALILGAQRSATAERGGGRERGLFRATTRRGGEVSEFRVMTNETPGGAEESSGG